MAEEPKVGVNRGNAGKGRPKGTPNKTTALLKDAILKAAEQAGNKVGSEGLVSYLEQQAEENPAPFLTLLGKVLPLQVTGAGKDGAHLTELVVRVERGQA
jgi:hypothetical protein